MPTDPIPGELVRAPFSDVALPGPAAGATAIARERIRQVEEEGYSERHDDKHAHGELARAAALYAIPPEHRGIDICKLWPWGNQWKPTADDRIRELEKAGALIAAEIDRLHRVRDRNEEMVRHVG